MKKCSLIMMASHGSNINPETPPRIEEVNIHIPKSFLQDCFKQIMKPNRTSSMFQQATPQLSHASHSAARKNPNIVDQPVEKCGGFILSSSSKIPKSSSKSNSEFSLKEYGASEGEIDFEDVELRPMCIPQVENGKPMLVWHTHPVGIYPIPSAEDILMPAVKEEMGDPLLSLLLTECGIWIFHRGVDDTRNEIYPPLWTYESDTEEELSDMLDALLACVRKLMAKYDASGKRLLPSDVFLFMKDMQDSLLSNHINILFYPDVDYNNDLHIALPEILVRRIKEISDQ